MTETESGDRTGQGPVAAVQNGDLMTITTPATETGSHERSSPRPPLHFQAEKDPRRQLGLLVRHLVADGDRRSARKKAAR